MQVLHRHVFLFLACYHRCPTIAIPVPPITNASILTATYATNLFNSAFFNHTDGVEILIPRPNTAYSIDIYKTFPPVHLDPTNLARLFSTVSSYINGEIQDKGINTKIPQTDPGPSKPEFDYKVANIQLGIFREDGYELTWGQLRGIVRALNTYYTRPGVDRRFATFFKVLRDQTVIARGWIDNSSDHVSLQ